MNRRPGVASREQVMLPLHRHEARREPFVQVVTDVLKTDAAVKEFFKSFKEDPTTERTRRILERVEAPHRSAWATLFSLGSLRLIV